MSNCDQENQIVEWINQQPVKWAAFTLKCPRFRSRERWERLLTDAFHEIEHTYVKSPEKMRRKHAGVFMLSRVVHLGGDKDKDIALHAQGIVEIIDDDLDRLEQKITTSWLSAVKSNERFLASTSKIPLEREAKVWIEKYYGSNAYTHYLNRFEGSNLGFGVQKIVWSASSLKPYVACILKP